MTSENYILSIETSGNTCGVAISCDNILIAEYNVFKPNSHDKVLAELIKRIVKDCDISFDQLKAIALSSGPGSFTGLRIGTAIAKGLCFNNTMKLLPVPTLDAIAYYFSTNFSESKLDIISFLPSNKDLYYHQKYNTDLAIKSDIELSTINEIIFNNPEAEMICGVISPKDSELYKKIKIITLTAGLISKLADKLYYEGKFADAEEFTPLYVQDFIPKTK